MSSLSAHDGEDQTQAGRILPCDIGCKARAGIAGRGFAGPVLAADGALIVSLSWRLSGAKFSAYGASALDHGTQFGEGNVARQVKEAAIGKDEEFLRRKHLERLADAFGDDVGRFDGVVLHVDHAEAQFERRVELAEEVEILHATAGKFERELLDLRIENFRE